MNDLSGILLKNRNNFAAVVAFDPEKEKIIQLHLDESNTALKAVDINDTAAFSVYIDTLLREQGARYAIGGYNENRSLYRRSKLFSGSEPRTLHLGTDIWGEAGTRVFSPLGGVVHSFSFNNQFGDYGATIVIQYQLEAKVFHVLYGHLSLKDISGLVEGKFINRGELIGHFGEAAENGNWPPHLHIQLISDMRVHRGDYPGVCSLKEKDFYLANCPDPDLLLNMLKYTG
ncbi:MAG: peptidoglycan DD-metalloendopeptidase family protein [Ferruginibacter sp.]